MVAIDVDFTSVSIPANTSASVTVYEDVDDDGGSNSDSVAGTTVSYDNKDSVSLSDGTTSYTTADTFDGGSGNSYQVYTELDNTDVESVATETWNDLQLTVPDPGGGGGGGGGGKDDDTVAPGLSPINLPLGELNVRNMSTGTAIYLLGFITLVGGGAAMLRNYVAGIAAALSVVALILAGTMGLGLEVFYAFIVAGFLALAAGFGLRWSSA